MSDNKYIMSSLDNALVLIETLSEHKSLTLTDLHNSTGFSRSSLFKMLYTLENRGFVTKSDDLKYSLSTRFMHIGSFVLSNIDLPTAASRHIKQLSITIAETVHLAILTDDLKNAVFLSKEVSTRPSAQMNVRMDSFVGRHLPSYCTSLGKSMLAFYPSSVIDNVFGNISFTEYTEHTITNVKDLKKQLVHIREHGYALDDEEFEEGLYCIGAPVFNMNGHPVGAISVSGPKQRLLSVTESYAEEIKKASRSISYELGHIQA